MLLLSRPTLWFVVQLCVVQDAKDAEGGRRRRGSTTRHLGDYIGYTSNNKTFTS